MNSKKVMLAEDDVIYQKLILNLLTREDFSVMIVEEGTKVLKEYRQYQPDLLLLDIMMPGLDGFEVCRKIREESNLPIIILSAKNSSSDKILGLTLGCDDYITKPFDHAELLLRVKAVLRRSRDHDQPDYEDSIIRLPGLTINQITRQTKVGDKEVVLTPKEFAFLWLLVNNPDRVFTRRQLLYQIWDSDLDLSTEVITTLVKRLREKIESDVSNPYFIKTVYGVGYKLSVKSSTKA